MKLDWLGHLTGRVLIALLFIPAGVLKIVNPEPFLSHMHEFGIAGSFLPLVAVFEIGTGLSVLFGLLLRPAGVALGLFCITTALVFHFDWTLSIERTLFAKDLAIAGGVFILAFSNKPQRYLHD